MVNQKHILIAGGGIAGPTLALLLSRAGHRSTIVEKADRARSFGQVVDISGPGLKVVQYLGLLDTIRERVSKEAGLRFVDASNRTMAEFAQEGGNSSTSLIKEIEIMRGDLAELLCDRVEADPNVDMVFGDYITGLAEGQASTTVSFAKGKAQDFDLVVAADGLYSKTRELAFGKAGAEIKSLNVCATLLSVPSTEADGKWARWCHFTGGRGVLFRPCGRGTGLTGAYLTVCSDDAPRLARLSMEKQKQEFAALFRDAGWETDRVLRAMTESKDLYFSEAAQIKAPAWTKGRVALLGDAGYAPSPISGQGTTLAFVGAYVLAGCIATYPDHEEALRQYEVQLKPFVVKAQTLIPGTPWIANPQTALGIEVLNYCVWFVTLIIKSGIAGWIGWAVSPLIPFFQRDLSLPAFSMFRVEE